MNEEHANLVNSQLIFMIDVLMSSLLVFLYELDLVRVARILTRMSISSQFQWGDRGLLIYN